ncbi:MAG: methylated-DNA--[protein]-cysteine S-methyltransferase [Terrimicrobiaceae bacterium]|nr:methylated-DNA--[protein]-cysteine S-methyltransferase [Terrimicrobiaceae bacterium]
MNLLRASSEDIRSGGAGWTIRTAVVATRFGDVWVAECPHGISRLVFLDGPDDVAAEQRRLENLWPKAAIETDSRELAAAEDGILERSNLFVRGTDFQVRVWEALMEIPTGKLTTYKAIAAQVGAPSASRAVGGAVGENPIAILIPCHRVIATSGDLGGYRWGLERKRTLLAAERESQSAFAF